MRQFIAAIAVACVISTGVGFAIAEVVTPGAARAGGSSQVVSQLRTLNATASSIKKSLGAIYQPSSVLGLLYTIDHNTTDLDNVGHNMYETCHAVGGLCTFTKR